LESRGLINFFQNIGYDAEIPNRVLCTNKYGRIILQRTNDLQGVRFIVVHYCSRALEWLNLRQCFTKVFSHFNLSEHISLEKIAFSWTYDKNLASRIYKPSNVFRHFSFIDLLDESSICVCLSVKRFRPFLDPLTESESSDFCPPSVHVRTTDLDIVQHPLLRAAIAKVLNHIPIKPTDFHNAITVVIDTFMQLFMILNLSSFGLDLQMACSCLRDLCLSKLRQAAKLNKFGFKFFGPYLFEIPTVNNELDWLLKHLYVAGLDKASNNACLMCICHIRLQAFQRLMGLDFTPCKTKDMWDLPIAVFDNVMHEVTELLPEAPPLFKALPYLMATYKLHKKKYRWLTNAFQTVYTNIALMLTVSTVQILESFKSWAKCMNDGYRRLL
jgi:hypothetical protein